MGEADSEGEGQSCDPEGVALIDASSPDGAADPVAAGIGTWTDEAGSR